MCTHLKNSLDLNYLNFISIILKLYIFKYLMVMPQTRAEIN